jgi:hypothetical protein
MSKFKLIDLTKTVAEPSIELEITSVRELRLSLSELRNRDPAFVDLVAPNGDALTIGVSQELGFVQYVNSSLDPPYLVAIDNRRMIEDGIMVFDAGGTPTEIALNECISMDLAIEIAEHFFLTGQLAPYVYWKEI